MLKTVVAGAAALFVAASPLAHAQTPSAAPADRLKTSERLNITDRNALTDLRIDLVKGRVAINPRPDKILAACRERYPCQGGGSESPFCKNRRNNG